MEQRFANLLRAWQEDLTQWVRHDAPKLLAVLVVAFILVRLLGLITRHVVEFAARSAGAGGRVQQARTVAGVIHSAGVFTVVFVATLQVLPIFGVNIAPLLASAGIAGLAIGFGAQSVVKDVINGFFILVENQFEVGDSIRVAGVSGTVEEISMRRTSLRDGDGALHIVPNSDIRIVSNLTRDWSQLALHVTVDYGEESERVMGVLRDVSQEFYNDETFHPDLLAAPEAPGIERISGREVEYLVVAKVRPGRQYGAARELRRRIKIAFEQNNIKTSIPNPVVAGQPAGPINIT